MRSATLYRGFAGPMKALERNLRTMGLYEEASSVSAIATWCASGNPNAADFEFRAMTRERRCYLEFEPSLDAPTFVRLVRHTGHMPSDRHEVAVGFGI